MAIKKMSVSLENEQSGVFTFKVLNTDFIVSCSVGLGAKRGDGFQIHYEDNSETKTVEALWYGPEFKQALDPKHVIHSIKRSELYHALNIDSDAFHTAMCDEYSNCRCNYPAFKLPFDEMAQIAKVVGADLAYPQYPRTKSRQVSFVAKCDVCNDQVVFSRGLGSYHTTGLKTLKEIACDMADRRIVFSKIITELD